MLNTCKSRPNISISGQIAMRSQEKSGDSVSIFQNGHTFNPHMINIVINHFSIEPFKSFSKSLSFKNSEFQKKITSLSEIL